MSSPASGWYPDPQGPPGQQRWWDSSNATWGEFTRERTASTQRQAIDVWALVAAIGCLGMLVGPFAPWVTALGGVLSRSGVDSANEDAWIMLAFGLGCTLLVFQWISSGQTRDLALLVTAGIVAALAGWHIADIENHHASLGIGWGLYVNVIGATAVALVGFLGLFKSR